MEPAAGPAVALSSTTYMVSALERMPKVDTRSGC
jgi:hypothetical protein